MSIEIENIRSWFRELFDDVFFLFVYLVVKVSIQSVPMAYKYSRGLTHSHSLFVSSAFFVFFCFNCGRRREDRLRHCFVSHRIVILDFFIVSCPVWSVHWQFPFLSMLWQSAHLEIRCRLIIYEVSPITDNYPFFYVIQVTYCIVFDGENRKKEHDFSSSASLSLSVRLCNIERLYV